MGRRDSISARTSLDFAPTFRTTCLSFPALTWKCFDQNSISAKRQMLFRVESNGHGFVSAASFFVCLVAMMISVRLRAFARRSSCSNAVPFTPEGCAATCLQIPRAVVDTLELWEGGEEVARTDGAEIASAQPGRTATLRPTEK